MAAVAFLRAMNVGGRRITNDALASAFHSFGFADATPYQASGNVILPSATPSSSLQLKELRESIEAGLQSKLGYAVPTFVRSKNDVEAIVASCPFGASKGPEGGKPQLIFLTSLSMPTEAGLAPLLPPGDQWTVLGSEIHWLPAGGLSTNELSYAGLEKVVGSNTVRTLGTVQRILKKL